jgi:DNA-binding beta-propeller fold protein YncE
MDAVKSLAGEDLRDQGPRFEVRAGWGELPAGWRFVEVAGVATDSLDRVFVFNRGEHPVMIFDRDGRFASSWGENLFVRPHGITIGPDDAVYCTDDLDHTVRRFTPNGTLLLTLGTSGCPSDTGATSQDFRTIRRAGPPFHYPTNLALAADGSLYIADGYGNASIHRFSQDGRHLLSWGEPGGGPGQFRVPHGIAVGPDGTVVVADRENSRLQFFSPAGQFLTEWTEIARPCQVVVDAGWFVYVAELGYKAGMWPGTTTPSPLATGGRVSVFDSSGRLLARWGGGSNPCAPGHFFAPHDLCLDSRGDLYVGEVTQSAGGNRGAVPSDCHALQKFARLG